MQGRDRSPSYPLISGDGFRHLCRLRCEDPDCNFKAEDVGEGEIPPGATFKLEVELLEIR